VRKILFSSLILLFATWALPSSAAAATCPDPAFGDVSYTVEGSGNTTVTDCTSGTGNPNSKADFNTLDVFDGGWTSFCQTEGGAGEDNGTCSAYDLEVNQDGTWSFTGNANEEYAIVLKDGNNPGDHSWAAFLLSDPDLDFAGTWEILFNGDPNPGRLSHVSIIDRPLATTPTTTPDSTDTTPDSTTPGPVVPEPTLLTLLGGGMLLAGRRLRRRK
jgi:hypothetical protein